jgi:hypothetical protein
MPRRLPVCMACVAAVALWVSATPAPTAEPTSEMDERLKKALQRFPKADLDGDSVLTRREAREARERLRKQRGGTRPQQAERPRGPEPTLKDVSCGPHERNVHGLKAGTQVEVVDENRTIAAADGHFTDRFDPLAVHIYRMKP